MAAKRHKLYLLGESTKQSRSPQLYNLAAKKLNRAIDYQCLDVAEKDFDELLAQLLNDPYTLGLNITAPYKFAAAKLMRADTVSVNTIYNDDECVWRGISTDGKGVLLAAKELGARVLEVDRYVFWGFGGAAFSLLEALNEERQLNYKVTVFVRDEVKPIYLQHPLFEKLKPQILKMVDAKTFSQKTHNSFFIQASSQSLYEDNNVNHMNHVMSSCGIFLEMRYGDIASQVEEFAKKNNCPYIPGLEMLASQAWLSQKKFMPESSWTYGDWIRQMKSSLL